LLREKREPIAAKPGKTAKEDSEYVREGSATAFLLYAPFDGIRKIIVSEDGRRTARNYVDVIEYLVDEMYSDAEKTLLVEEDLNIHRDASLYENFEPATARRLASKIERHHTPKHGSWLNIAEIEISAVSRTTFPDRVGSLEEFRALCELGEERRNQSRTRTAWRFTNERARIKLNSLYPSIED
jgi:hypothetical protein